MNPEQAPPQARPAEHADHELRALVRRLNHYVENSPLAVIEWDADLRVSRWTAEAEAVFGWRAEEVLGKRRTEWPFVHPDDAALVEHAVAGLAEGDRRHSVSANRNLTRDGRLVHCEWYNTSFHDERSRLVSMLSLVLDVTERKRAEEDALHARREAERVRRRAELLAEAGAVLSASLDRRDTLAAVARLVVPTLADACTVDMVDDATGGTVHMELVHVDPDQQARLREMCGWHTLNPARPEPALEVLRTGRPLLLAEISDEVLRSIARGAEHLRVLRELRPRSVMLVPMMARDQALGVISMVRSDAERPYTDGDLAFAEDLARRAALAVDNARLYEEAQAARRAAECAADRTERLQAVTAALSEALTPAQVAGVIVEQGLAALGASAGFAGCVSGDGTEVEMLRVVGYSEEVLEPLRIIPVHARFPATDAIRTAEPVWLASADACDTRYPHLARFTAEPSYQAWAAVPMVVEGRVVGVWGLSFGAPRDLSEDERAFALTLARQCGQAMERARLYTEAVEANRAKVGFLATMSHELRTPLNAMIGYVDLLQMGVPEPLPERARRHVDRVGFAARHLLSIIEEVLTFSRIEVGRESVSVEALDLSELVREVSAIVEPLAAAKQLRFRGPEAPPTTWLVTDPRKLRQILINLLGNAVKFTVAGEVRFDVDLEDASVAFHVQDTGVGIPAEHLETIWEPFRQVDDAITRSAGGTGLGLSVARRLARLLGGDVEVQSMPGEGSTFTLRLPLGEWAYDPV